MPINWQVDVLGTAASTQDIVREAAQSGAAEGYAVQALQQMAGRGRHGREWDSPMGNLYLSVLLRPGCSPEEAGQLAFVAAVALSEAMDLYCDAKVHQKTLKWPNDILINGLKTSGIILESNIKNNSIVEWIALGTGVNIFAPPDGTCGLDGVKSKPIYVNVFRDDYLAKLADKYTLWKQKGFASIREAWLKQAHGLGHGIEVRFSDKVLGGKFKGLDEHGALLLETDQGLKTIHAGEIYFG